jgi:hypothetical protein
MGSVNDRSWHLAEIASTMLWLRLTDSYSRKLSFALAQSIRR